MELSKRELEVLRLAAQGKTNREIALELGVSHKTVEKHRGAACAALGAASRTEAVVRALAQGLLDEKGSAGRDSPTPR